MKYSPRHPLKAIRHWVLAVPLAINEATRLLDTDTTDFLLSVDFVYKVACLLPGAPDVVVGDTADGLKSVLQCVFEPLIDPVYADSAIDCIDRLVDGLAAPINSEGSLLSRSPVGSSQDVEDNEESESRAAQPTRLSGISNCSASDSRVAAAVKAWGWIISCWEAFAMPEESEKRVAAFEKLVESEKSCREEEEDILQDLMKDSLSELLGLDGLQRVDDPDELSEQAQGSPPTASPSVRPVKPRFSYARAERRDSMQAFCRRLSTNGVQSKKGGWDTNRTSNASFCNTSNSTEVSTSSCSRLKGSRAVVLETPVSHRRTPTGSGLATAPSSKSRAVPKPKASSVRSAKAAGPPLPPSVISSSSRFYRDGITATRSDCERVMKAGVKGPSDPGRARPAGRPAPATTKPLRPPGAVEGPAASLSRENSMKSQMEDLKAENLTLYSDKRQLEVALEEKSKLLDSLSSNVVLLEESLRQKDALLLEQRNSEIDSACEGSESRQEGQRLAAQNQRLKDRVLALERALAAAQSSHAEESEELQREAAMLRESLESQRDAAEEVRRLQDDCVRYSNSITTLEHDLDQSHQQSKRLSRQVEILSSQTSRLKALQKEVAEMEAKLTDEKLKSAIQTETIEELNKNLSNLQSAALASRSEPSAFLDSSRPFFDGGLSHADPATKTLKEKIRTLEAEKMDLESTIAKMTSELSQSTATEDVERLRAANGVLTQLLEDGKRAAVKADREIGRLEIDLKGAESELTTLRMAITESRADANKLSEEKAEMRSAYEGRLASQQKLLKSATDNLMEAVTGAREKQTQIETLEARLETAEGERKRLEDELDQSRTNLDEVSHEVGRLRGDLKVASADLEKVKGELKMQEIRMGEKEASLHQATVRIATLEERLTDSEVKATEMTELLSNQSKALMENQLDSKDKDCKLSQTKKELSSATAQMRRLESEVLSLRKTNEVLCRDLEKMKLRCVSEANKGRQLEHDISVLRSEYEGLAASGLSGDKAAYSWREDELRECLELVKNQTESTTTLDNCKTGSTQASDGDEGQVGVRDVVAFYEGRVKKLEGDVRKLTIHLGNAELACQTLAREKAALANLKLQTLLQPKIEDTETTVGTETAAAAAASPKPNTACGKAESYAPSNPIFNENHQATLIEEASRLSTSKENIDFITLEQMSLKDDGKQRIRLPNDYSAPGRDDIPTNSNAVRPSSLSPNPQSSMAPSLSPVPALSWQSREEEKLTPRAIPPSSRIQQQAKAPETNTSGIPPGLSASPQSSKAETEDEKTLSQADRGAKYDSNSTIGLDLSAGVSAQSGQLKGLRKIASKDKTGVKKSSGRRERGERTMGFF